MSGNITISPAGPVAVGTPLTAAYSGSETVSYQWNRNITTNVGTNSTTYTPDQAGSYTVTVSATGYMSKTSLPVIVTDLLDNTGTQTNPIIFTDTNGSYPGILTTARQAVWYSFTANGRYDLTVRDYQYRPTNAATSPYTADVRVSVLDATFGYVNDINNRQMNAVDIGADNQSPVIFTDLTGVYYVKIEPYSAGGTGTFYVALANTGPVTTGAGQADAIDITSYSPVPFELELTSSRPTRWFKFTADGRYDLTVGDYQYNPGTSTTSPYTVDARVSVLDANLGYVADINNRQMNAVDIGANNQSPVILTDLSGVYYVKIDRYSEYSSFGSFLVTLEKTGPVTAGAGQADAITLTVGAARIRDELTSSRPSRWFKFTAPAGGSVGLTVYDSQYQPSGLTEEKPNVDARVTVLDASLQFVSNSSGTAMNGIDIGANNQSPVTFNSLTPGSVYYVKIDRYSEYSNYGFFYIGVN